MLLTKKQGKKFWLRIHISLRSSSVDVEEVPGSNFYHEFRLHCRARSFILYAEYQEEKEGWIVDLRNSIKGTHESELKDEEDKAIVERERAKERASERRAESRRRSVRNVEPERRSEKKSDSAEAHKPRLPSETGSKSRSASVTALSRKPRPASSAGPGSSASGASRQKKTTKVSTMTASTGRPRSEMYARPVPIDVSNDSIFIYSSNLNTPTNNSFMDIPALQQNPFLTTPSPAGPAPTLLSSPFTTNGQTASPFAASPFLTNQSAYPTYTVPISPSPLLTNSAGAAPYSQASPLSFSSPAFATTSARPTSITYHAPPLATNPNPFMTNPNRSSVYKPSVNPFMTNPNSSLFPQAAATAATPIAVPAPFTVTNAGQANQPFF